MFFPVQFNIQYASSGGDTLFFLSYFCTYSYFVELVLVKNMQEILELGVKQQTIKQFLI